VQINKRMEMGKYIKNKMDITDDKYLIPFAIVMILSVGILFGFMTETFQDLWGMTFGSNTHTYCAEITSPDGIFKSTCAEIGWEKGEWITREFTKYGGLQ